MATHSHNLFIFVQRSVQKCKNPNPSVAFQPLHAILLTWFTICYSLNNLTFYENLNRDFPVVHSFDFVLAPGTRIDFSSSYDLVNPSTVPNHWIFA
jgi:hypothetical protein